MDVECSNISLRNGAGFTCYVWALSKYFFFTLLFKDRNYQENIMKEML